MSGCSQPSKAGSKYCAPQVLFVVPPLGGSGKEPAKGGTTSPTSLAERSGETADQAQQRLLEINAQIAADALGLGFEAGDLGQ